MIGVEDFLHLSQFYNKIVILDIMDVLLELMQLVNQVTCEADAKHMQEIYIRGKALMINREGA